MKTVKQENGDVHLVLQNENEVKLIHALLGAATYDIEEAFVVPNLCYIYTHFESVTGCTDSTDLTTITIHTEK